MQTLTIRQDLIERLVKLNSSNKFFLNADKSNVDWPHLKIDIQQDLDKLKKYAKVFEILAYVCFAITAILSLIKIFSETFGPDLNKAALLIFFTVSNMFSAFTQRLRVERLEKQILLLELLEKIDQQN